MARPHILQCDCDSCINQAPLRLPGAGVTRGLITPPPRRSGCLVRPASPALSTSADSGTRPELGQSERPS